MHDEHEQVHYVCDRIIKDDTLTSASFVLSFLASLHCHAGVDTKERPASFFFSLWSVGYYVKSACSSAFHSFSIGIDLQTGESSYCFDACLRSIERRWRWLRNVFVCKKVSKATIVRNWHLLPRLIFLLGRITALSSLPKVPLTLSKPCSAAAF